MKDFWKMMGVAFLAGCLLLTSGCGVSGSEQGKMEKYSAAQRAVIASTEKNRWEAAFGSGILEMKTGENTTFAEELSDEVDGFMRDLRVVRAACDDHDITLNRTETKAAKSAAAEYYDSLTDADRESLGGISRDEVQALYHDYLLAVKYAETLAGSEALEVSDSEAKVIRVLRAASDDRETAEKLQEAVAAGGDFTAEARALGLAPEECAVGRGECGTDDMEARALEDAEFALSPGDMTGVMSSGGKFYVVQCLDDYDEEATAERRQRIGRQRVSTALKKICMSYGEPEDSEGTPASLDAADNLPDCPPEADFFAIFEKYRSALSS
jgi:foldase protein PrsA